MGVLQSLDLLTDVILPALYLHPVFVLFGAVVVCCKFVEHIRVVNEFLLVECVSVNGYRLPIVLLESAAGLTVEKLVV